MYHGEGFVPWQSCIGSLLWNIVQVDSHIQRLDKDLKKFEEELRRGAFLGFDLMVCCITLWLLSVQVKHAR